jgi:hypothetical protein
MAWAKTGWSCPSSLFFFVCLFVCFIGITGSQWQSNIWFNFHVKHSWSSHILSANSCGPWSCTEQVSIWMLVCLIFPIFLPYSFLSFRSLFFFYICITLYNNYTSSLSLSKMTVLELESDNMKGQILGDILKLLLSWYQSFQHEKRFSSAGGGTRCWRDGKESQSLDCAGQQAASFGLCMCLFFFSFSHLYFILFYWF